MEFLVRRGADHITCICLIAAPEGIARLEDVVEPLTVPCTLSSEQKLNDVGYILPRLGDAVIAYTASSNADLSESPLWCSSITW